jgi:hypothetical protein
MEIMQTAIYGGIHFAVIKAVSVHSEAKFCANFIGDT